MKITPQEALSYIGCKFADKQESNEPYLCTICNHPIPCLSCGVFKNYQQDFVVEGVQY